uniref:Integrase, catalytic region, zinc finger, CCHC-type, peptidase aspartic, catalytic n=1 Tax=Tanacetum cinerariifolium TaxID=118510 RepID=A0A699GS89_TANCI|nr:integrase, catalytic region, zinc finger, CCHC-type, peptidase aspartic, catalytic [Tanacetum cinerariifolium]
MNLASSSRDMVCHHRQDLVALSEIESLYTEHPFSWSCFGSTIELVSFDESQVVTFNGKFIYGFKNGDCGTGSQSDNMIDNSRVLRSIVSLIEWNSSVLSTMTSIQSTFRPSKEVGTTITEKVIGSVLDVETQIILSENVRNHRVTRTKRRLLEVLGVIAVRKMIIRLKTKCVSWLKHLASYTRAMIELRADVKLKDNIVVTMPKITREGHCICNVHVEYEWKPLRCASCKVLNFQKEYRPVPKRPTSSSSGNKKKGVESTIQVTNSNLFEVLNSVDNDVELGTNGGTTNLVNNEATLSGSSFVNVDNTSTSTTLIIDKIGKFEELLTSGQAILVDEAGFSIQSFLEQRRDSYGNGDYDEDPYDDDMYEEPDEWIKDSGCSKHMTGNQKLFSTYKAYNGGNIIFNSNLHGNIIGKESLNMKFDETLLPSETSSLVDDDLEEEEEAIKVIKKKNLENDIEDETLEVNKVVNIK